MKAIKEMEGFTPDLEVLGYVWPFSPKPDGTLIETPTPERSAFVVTKEEYDIIIPIMERVRVALGHEFLIKFNWKPVLTPSKEYPPSTVKINKSERDMYTRKNLKNNDSP